MTTAFPVEDKFRFIIEEARTGVILTDDLVVEAPKILRQLSGPCAIEFDIHPLEPSVQGIVFKPWGHWCHVEKDFGGGDKRIIVSGIFKPSDTDPETGKLHAQFEGFSGYAKGLPWLQNWNPIAVDPFEIFDRVWMHLQSYSNGDLGVTVYSPGEGDTKVIPPVSNTQLLPGMSLQAAQGADFILEFFAIFIRAIDFTDCGDYLNKLARDIPFDYFEEAEWNEDRSAINKFIRLEYPHGGALQTNLAFRFDENIIRGKTRIESEIEWTSDVIIRGWFPGKVYSSTVSNADSTRYRRTILEEDAKINSIERSEAWAHRQLTRRQWPHFWETITVNMYHPHARFGTWDVGDQIRVQGPMPWIGQVDQVHKIIAWSLDEASSTCELTLKAEGAFNYDPIFFQGAELNLLTNGTFDIDLSGWTQLAGTWTRDAVVGSESPGSAKVTATGATKTLMTTGFQDATPGEVMTASCAVAWGDAASAVGSSPIWLSAIAYRADNSEYGEPVFDSITNPTGDSDGWQTLFGSWRIPNDVDKIKLRLMVRPEMSSGDVWFDDVSVTETD